VVRAAEEEDVDAIGVSILSGAHGTVLPRIRARLNAAGMESVLLLAGGTIPEDEALALVADGTVDRVFTPGAPLADIVGYLEDAVATRRSS
jgi:methylmalonyl-CoA mutase C-terminal domain/subunit